MYITFEGVNSSGKSTVMDGVVLDNSVLMYKITRGLIGERFRIRGLSNLIMMDFSMQNPNIHVLNDRSFISNIVYNHRDVSEQTIQKFMDKLNSLKHYVFYFDISWELYEDRYIKRTGQKLEDAPLDKAFYEGISKRYTKFLNRKGVNCEIISADKYNGNECGMIAHIQNKIEELIL